MFLLPPADAERRDGNFHIFWPMLPDAWMREFRAFWGASRRFRWKACAWLGTGCLWTRRKPNGSLVLRPDRLRPPWSARWHGTNRTVTLPRDARRLSLACVRLK